MFITIVIFRISHKSPNSIKIYINDSRKFRNIFLCGWSFFIDKRVLKLSSKTVMEIAKSDIEERKIYFQYQYNVKYFTRNIKFMLMRNSIIGTWGASTKWGEGAGQKGHLLKK